jgi:hypothetical protein
MRAARLPGRRRIDFNTIGAKGDAFCNAAQPPDLSNASQAFKGALLTLKRAGG